MSGSARDRVALGMGPRTGFALTLAGGCHLGFLALVATYLIAYYPAATPAVLLLLLTAVVSETCPAALKRWLFGEALLIIAATGTYAALVDPPAENFQGWLRMVLAYWLLIPARVGLLRWLLSLVIAELLILGAGHAAFLDLRVPLTGRSVLASPLLLLLPIALGSLAVDNWLSGVAAARVRGPRPPSTAALARWSALPAIALIALLLTAGPGVVRHEKRVQPKVPTAQSGVRKPRITPGEAQWVVKDETPRARLLWEDTAHPQITGMAYLRAFTLPRIVLEQGGFVTWEGERLDGLRVAPGAFDPGERFAWAVRLPMGSDAVLHADGARGVDMEELLADRHGNLYVVGIDEVQRAYRVNLDPPATLEEEDPDPAAYTALPGELALMPWDRIEDPSWRGLDAATAAAVVSNALGERCTYDLENLPAPAPGPAGILRTFLFGADHERRGHCQYFATAGAIMLRRLGHPARCVSGYASDESDADGFTFRGLHAHAWLEVRDAGGRWLRVDPTPASRMATMHERGIDPASAGLREVTAMTLPGKPTSPPPPIAKRARGVPGGLILAAVAVAAITLALCWRRKRGIPLTPVQAALQRQHENLVRVAQQLGVPVADHTTLSELAARLSARTGVDLGRHLAAHLDARFGGGPLPPPWPIDLLRAGGAARMPPQKTR